MPDAEIRYARNGGVAIAYRVVGNGPVDLVYVPEFVSNLVFNWQTPRKRSFYLRLARSFRLILFDKRGTGISDHGGQFATLETRMEDLHAVIDAAGSSQPVVFGAHEGSGMAVLFAATYPERTRALVLFHAEATGDAISSEKSVEQELAQLRDGWGTREFCDALFRDYCPSLASSEESAAHLQTVSASARAPRLPMRSTERSPKATCVTFCRRCTCRPCSCTAR